MSVVRGDTSLLHSQGPNDWLGSGMYFWEADRNRALEWAKDKSYGAPIKEPYVIGAVIHLGKCLDLLHRESSEILRDAYDGFVEVQAAAKKELPVNLNGNREPDPDGVMRRLDCAVLNHLLKRLEGPDNIEGVPRYDTVRAYFREGTPIYSGSGFHEKNHSQIVVRNDECIKGFFLPLPLQSD